MATVCEKDFTLSVSGAPEPDFYWTLDDTLVDSIESLAFSPPLVSNFGTGIINNGFRYAPTLNTQNNLVTGQTPSIQYSAGDPISFTFWMKWAVGFDANDQVTHHIDNDDGPGDLELTVRWGPVFGVLHIILLINDGVTFDSISTPFTINFGQWYFFAVVYDPATQLATLYQDTVAILATTIPIVLPTSAANQIRYRELGAVGGSTLDYILDECGWWLNHKLTPSELNILYNSGAGQRPTLP